MTSPGDRKPVRKVSVLLVEDAMDHALLVKTFLRSDGNFETTHVQDGDRAIQLLDEQDFDLVVTDLNLPGTDGFDVMRHILDGGLDVPVLAVTGYTSPQYGEQAFRTGAGAVLHKPLHRDEVLENVYDLLPERVFESGDSGAVIAVGARPGDVEVGCGGTLARHAQEGRDVLVVVLDRRIDESTPDGSDAARMSAEHLGCRIHMADASVDGAGGPAELQLSLGRLADELKPAVAYVPAPGDRRADRAVASRLGRAALQKTPTVFGYLTSTSRDDLAPDHFVEVGDTMAHKAECLAYYQKAGVHRKEMTADFLEEQLRRWAAEAPGREAEPFVDLKREEEVR